MTDNKEEEISKDNTLQEMNHHLPTEDHETNSNTSTRNGIHNYIREAVLEYEAEHHGKPSYRHRTPLRYNIKIQNDETHIILVAGSHQDDFHNYVRDAVLKYETEHHDKPSYRHQTPLRYNVKIQDDDTHTILVAASQQDHPA